MLRFGGWETDKAKKKFFLAKSFKIKFYDAAFLFFLNSKYAEQNVINITS